MSGDEDTDNGKAEIISSCLEEEILPPNLQAIIITDSTTTMATYQMIQDGNIPSNRSLIWMVMSGEVKECTDQLLFNIELWSQPENAYNKTGPLFYKKCPHQKNLSP